MPRSGRIKKRKAKKDPRYQSEVIQCFINKLMSRGKKSKAEIIMYGALSLLQEKMKKDPIELFNQVMKSVAPLMEVKSRRVGGATYQVPIEVTRERGEALAMNWIREAAQERAGKTMIEKLAAEFMDALNNTGGAVKKREDTHKTAESNKAFAHFRW